jgi:hypothetical protein
MNTVIEIDVSRPSVISLDEGACTRAHKAMTSFIADCVVGFRFNDQPSARTPIELATDEIAGTAQRIALEKISPQHFARWSQRTPPTQLPGL